jgi:hypothetical protein
MDMDDEADTQTTTKTLLTNEEANKHKSYSLVLAELKSDLKLGPNMQYAIGQTTVAAHVENTSSSSSSSVGIINKSYSTVVDELKRDVLGPNMQRAMDISSLKERKQRTQKPPSEAVVSYDAVMTPNKQPNLYKTKGIIGIII